MNKFYALLLMVACGCASPTQQSRDDNKRSMIGLDEPVRVTDLWKEWTVTKGHALPTDFSKKAVAFDYWLIADDARKEEHWAALFSILNFLRDDPRLDEKRRLTTSSLMSSLEGAGTQLDATYLVSTSTSDQWEGIATRYARNVDGAVSSVTVFAQRKSPSGESFSRVWVWLQPGFEEPPSITLFLDLESGKNAITDGVIYNRAADNERSFDAVSRLLDHTIWQPMIHSAYVETERAPWSGELVVPKSLGMDVNDRLIDQVYSDTVFPPRLVHFGEDSRAK